MENFKCQSKEFMLLYLFTWGIAIFGVVAICAYGLFSLFECKLLDRRNHTNLISLPPFFPLTLIHHTRIHSILSGTMSSSSCWICIECINESVNWCTVDPVINRESLGFGFWFLFLLRLWVDVSTVLGTFISCYFTDLVGESLKADRLTSNYMFAIFIYAQNF